MHLEDKNKKRLILIDLDGTTLKDDHVSIHPKTRTMLHKAIAKGHVVCICTGRASRDAERVYHDLGLQTVLVSLDGGHISDPIHRSFKRIVLPISEEVIKGILTHPVLDNMIENGIIEYYNKSMSINPHDQFFVVNPDGTVEQGNIVDDWKGPSSNLILKLKSNHNFRHIVETINREFKNSVNVRSDLVYGVEFVGEKPIIIINNKYVSKGFAARMVAQYYDVSLKDTIAFGDEMNDYEMIKVVGHGIVLKNGNPKLKAIGWGVTDLNNDQGGLGDTLQKLLDL